MLKLAHSLVTSYMGITIRASPRFTSLTQHCRPFAATSPTEIQATLDTINDMFVEARDEISYAEEDAGTTYFNESYDGAKELVDKTLSAYNELLTQLPDMERGKIQRSMGMKMEQLKGELVRLDSLHD